MFDNLREDLRRYGQTPRQQLRAVLLVPGVWAIVAYRFARWAHTAQMPRLFRRLMNVAATLLSLAADVVTNIELPAGAQIGAGLFIAHNGYIVVAPGVRLGRHCTLTHGVTIGHAGGGGTALEHCPVIGDRVYIGPGSAIIGALNIGNDALIGVGAIVTRTVPPRGVAVGNPARVISRKGSFEVIVYEGMERDAERQAALSELRDEGASLLVEESTARETLATEHEQKEAMTPERREGLTGEKAATSDDWPKVLSEG